MWNSILYISFWRILIHALPMKYTCWPGTLFKNKTCRIHAWILTILALDLRRNEWMIKDDDYERFTFWYLSSKKENLHKRGMIMIGNLMHIKNWNWKKKIGWTCVRFPINTIPLFSLQYIFSKLLKDVMKLDAL